MQNQTSDRKDFICNPSRWSKAVLSPDVPCVDRGSIKRTPPCLSHCCALLVLLSLVGIGLTGVKNRRHFMGQTKRSLSPMISITIMMCL